MLMIFGGRIKPKVNEVNFSLNDIWVLQLNKLEWQKLDLRGSVPSKRYSHVSSLNDDKLVIFGGLSDHQFCDNNLYILELDPPRMKSLK